MGESAKHVTIRLALLLASLTFILWLNASKFDSTEIAAIVQYFLAAAGIESVARKFNINKGE